MGPKKSNNRFKIKCLECGLTMDYRMKHNRLFHAETLKQHKMVRWQNINDSKNPFEAALSRPANVPCIDEVSTSHVISASSIVDKFSTTDAIATITDRLSCNSTKIGELSSASSEERGKQSSTIQKPLVIDDMSYQSKDPKCFLDRGNKSRPFQPSWFDHKDWKNGYTTTKRGMLYSISHASKLLSRI